MTEQTEPTRIVLATNNDDKIREILGLQLPLAYAHPKFAHGLFVPTVHEHGSGARYGITICTSRA